MPGRPFEAPCSRDLGPCTAAQATSIVVSGFGACEELAMFGWMMDDAWPFWWILWFLVPLLLIRVVVLLVMRGERSITPSIGGDATSWGGANTE